MIYLDNNATTPLRPEVKAAYMAALDIFGNPSSVHEAGRDARLMVDDARRHVAELFHVRPEQVVFTSGGTEANVMALRGVMDKARGKRILSTPIEHASILKTCEALQEDQPGSFTTLLTDSNGIVSLSGLEAQLKQGDVALVSVQHANNETGVMQPLAGVRDLCRRYGALFHVDAVQTAGKMNMDIERLGMDLMSLSFHKFGGPKGVGALILRGEPDMNALMTGGGQERNRRAGTENLPALVAAGEAAKIAGNTFYGYARLADSQKALEAGLRHLANDIIIVGEGAERLPTTTAFIAPGVDAETAVMALDMQGIAVSQGSACASGRSEPSHVALALGYNREQACCGIRVAFGWQSVPEDADAFVKAYEKIRRNILDNKEE